jgi:hypothetical protein
MVNNQGTWYVKLGDPKATPAFVPNNINIAANQTSIGINQQTGKLEKYYDGKTNTFVQVQTDTTMNPNTNSFRDPTIGVNLSNLTPSTISLVKQRENSIKPSSFTKIKVESKPYPTNIPSGRVTLMGNEFDYRVQLPDGTWESQKSNRMQGAPSGRVGTVEVYKNDFGKWQTKNNSFKPFGTDSSGNYTYTRKQKTGKKSKPYKLSKNIKSPMKRTQHNNTIRPVSTKPIGAIGFGSTLLTLPKVNQLKSTKPTTIKGFGFGGSGKNVNTTGLFAFGSKIKGLKTPAKTDDEKRFKNVGKGLF